MIAASAAISPPFQGFWAAFTGRRTKKGCANPARLRIYQTSTLPYVNSLSKLVDVNLGYLSSLGKTGKLS
jgi:hypothetical protein